MTGILPSIMALIIVVAGAMGLIMLSVSFEDQHKAVISDPLNNSGNLMNDTPAYTAAKTTTDTVIGNLPIGIIFVLLLVVIGIVLLIMAVLKK